MLPRLAYMNRVSPSLRAALVNAVGTHDFGLEGVRRESLDYDAFLAHRAVHRVRGFATAKGQRLRWSLIEKTTEGPAIASLYLLDNAKRELVFYSSRLHDDLASAVRAPRVFGSCVEADGGVTLWLEEIQHEGPRPLDAGTILSAARDLGGLAGRWVLQTLDDPWLFTGWIDRQSQPAAVAEGLAILDRACGAKLDRWGDRLGEARRLVLAQEKLRDVLGTLPQTLCHHDAVGANVFRADARTVLIDWESVGPGPVGADLASLLFASARRGDASAAWVAGNINTALDAYLEGLRTETNTVNVQQVRRGLDAAIALRWKLAADVASSVERGEALRRGSRPDELPEQAADELSTLVGVLLGAARRVLDE